MDEGLEAIARADLMRSLSRDELYLATLLAALKFEADDSTQQLVAGYFKRLRELDGPNMVYGRNPMLLKLFAEEPALREIPAGTSTPTPLNPPYGVLPPDTPILDDVL